MTRWIPMLLVASSACAASDRAFPLREPVAVDTDLHPVSVACRPSPTPKDPHNVSCAPDVYVSPIIWDGADNLLFRPLSEAVGIERHGEAIYRFKEGMLPSDFFRRNVVLSFQEDAIGIRLRDVIGVDNMMWGSDYPHSESTFPQSRKILAEILAGVPDDEQAKIVGDNTARVYGFDVARLT